MASKQAQRIGIWIIVIIFAVSSIAVFFVLILSTQNQKTDQQRLTVACATYEKQLADQVTELSNVHYGTLSKAASKVSSFDADSVKKLAHEDLVMGTGDKITDSSSYSAYYIGWTPDGNIFEDSIEGDSLTAPIAVAPGSLIEGWSQGVIGMKLGGVRLLTIPSDLAYGEEGRPGSIGSNEPLKFIVLAIPSPTAITIPDALKPYEEYIKYGGISAVCQQ